MGLKPWIVQQKFDREPLALGVMRLPSRTPQPACCSSALALRNNARSCPDPSETGGTNGLAEHFLRHLAAEWLQ